MCSSVLLGPVLDFGAMALTGVFQKDGKSVPHAPLVLCRCQSCGLLQLGHSYSMDFLYGDTYGYESHLNSSMVGHLTRKAATLEKNFLDPKKKHVVVDIASNDGTLLSGYSNPSITRVGIDPLINVVSDHYPTGSIKIIDFFSAVNYWSEVEQPASLVTSLSVLYDLDNPIQFAKDVYEILNSEGIWHFEQSYAPTMFDTMSYDTVCHEHLLYLSLHDIDFLMKESGFQILNATLNSINGGSIAITAIKSKKKIERHPFVDYLLDKEKLDGTRDGKRAVNFAEDAHKHRLELQNLLIAYKNQGFTIKALGASTKGNVILQWLGIDSNIIECIGDVNPRKFGTSTPGSHIKIVPESEIMQNVTPKELVMVLPWHFRDGIIIRSQDLLGKGVQLLFPLPRIEVVSV